MILPVPVVRQQCDYDCGPTAYEAVVRYYGVPGGGPPVADPQQGLPPDVLEAAFRRAGLRVLAGEMADVAELVYHLGRSRPVVCLVRRGGVGHYVVARGVGTGRGLGPVYLMDPDGGYVRVGRRAFERDWRDVSRWGVEYRRLGLAVWSDTKR